MSYILPIFVSLILAACNYLTFKTTGFIDPWRDWRHGIDVDRTEEWQSFEILSKDHV